MSNHFPFLERLSLDENAAASDIRRAYARELKLIDQEHDLAGFQLLREAYEIAMRWSRRSETVPVPEPLPPLAPQEPVQLLKLVTTPPGVLPERTESQVNAYALADLAFAGLMKRFTVLAQGEVSPDLYAVQQLLERALDDQALPNISARAQLEGLVARLLAGGWQPGHEVLLVAAVRVFEWRSDRRRLADFGQVGMLLSRAIDERDMFDAQPAAEVAAQGLVVARLRRDGKLGASELVRGMRHLALLESRFPIWLALVTDVANIAHWRALHDQVPDWRRKLMFEQNAKPAKASHASGGGSHWWIWLTIVIIFNLIRQAAGSH